MNTKRSSAKGFLRKNGAYFALALVVFASVSAIYLTAFKNKQKKENLNGAEQNCTSLKADSKDVIKQQTPSQSQSQLSSQQQLQSKPSNSSVSSQKQEEVQESQKVLYILPVNGEIINKFSGTKPVKSKTMGDWRLHNGIDIKAEKGTSVKASGAGVISKVYFDAMWGGCVEIEHSDGRTTVYSSLSDKITVQKGQKVESGQAIGYVSDTAKIELSEQMHLHFAVKNGEKYEDPQQIITLPIK